VRLDAARKISVRSKKTLVFKGFPRVFGLVVPA
jgi:hypothetical protein